MEYGWITCAKDPDGLRRQGDEPHAGAEEYLVRSKDWRVFIGGREVPVLAVPVTFGGPHSFLSEDYKEGEEIVAIPCGRKAADCRISPARLRLIPDVIEQEGEGAVRFVPPRPGHYVIQADRDGERPLTVSLACRQPSPEQTVRYFGAGLHRMDTLELKDNDVIYLEAGAVIEAIPPLGEEEPVCDCDWAGRKTYQPFWRADQKKNIRITGRGMIDLSKLDWHARSALVLSGCENVSIDGITFIGSPAWTITLTQCKNIQIHDVRIYGHRENSDGINICSSEDVEVSGCFIRTGDDAVSLKGMLQPPVTGGRNIYVHGCVIWNDKVRCMGVTSETRNDISKAVFSGCDIVHSFSRWTKELGSLCIIVCDSGVISDLLFEDIWIEQEASYTINCMIMKDRWTVQKEAGQIRHIVFRNIHAPKGVPLNFQGFDGQHCVEDIIIENYTSDGCPAYSEDDLPIERNRFVKHIIVRGPQEREEENGEDYDS